ncbi:hypothetical protein DYB26_015346 [Aphanomyces astaci]|uniref:Uncharacterized protein n=1 Tax=Aphanomyces astaci TaxID=112090 RepID=A0A397EFL3_APHAT|nr:hypothetical protein DYB31_014300 [Aphanomyces astaci]RHZ00715.1 hypothetical protein DYB26_015346 [Aphanomyces astaci]
MARECPNKKDGDSGETRWKKGKNAVKRVKARKRKANMQAKRMKKPPSPTMDYDGRWVRLNNAVRCALIRRPYADNADGHWTSQGAKQAPLLCVNDGDKFLVSDDTLKTIGIDIDRLLEQVACLQVDEDGDDLEEVGGDCME